MATSTIEISRGDIDDLHFEAGSLIVEHHCEVQRQAIVHALSPDWGFLERMENADRAYVLLAKDDDECIGYCLSLASPHINNKDQWQLVNEAIYVDPIYRRRGVGLALIRCMEEVADQMRAECVWRAPAYSLLDQVLCRRNQYNATHTTYTRAPSSD